jgi:hypothetical protein
LAPQADTSFWKDASFWKFDSARSDISGSRRTKHRNQAAFAQCPDSRTIPRKIQSSFHAPLTLFVIGDRWGNLKTLKILVKSDINYIP